MYYDYANHKCPRRLEWEMQGEGLTKTGGKEWKCEPSSFLKAATFEKLLLLQDIKLSWQASFRQKGQFEVLTPPRYRVEPDSLAAQMELPHQTSPLPMRSRLSKSHASAPLRPWWWHHYSELGNPCFSCSRYCPRDLNLSQSRAMLAFLFSPAIQERLKRQTLTHFLLTIVELTMPALIM